MALMMPSAHRRCPLEWEWLVGCGWPSSIRVVRREQPSWPLINAAPVLASAADASHDIFDDLDDYVDGSIEGRVQLVKVADEKHDTSSTGPGLWGG